MRNNKLLSVRLMTYNHAEHIIHCLKSIDKQQTSFSFDVIIGDDFSTDNNKILIQKFISSSINKKISYILLSRNKHDKYDISREKNGRLYNFVDILNHCNSKYISLLDGDDYWTDPYKLQKQVDFLEANEDVNICFTRTMLLQNGKEDLQEIPSPFDKQSFSFVELIRHHNFIATASVMFKKPEPLNFPDWFYKVPFGDLGLYKLVSDNKKIQCINEAMAIYRIHDSGVWSGINAKKSAENYLTFYLVIFSALTNDEKKEAKKKIRSLLRKLASLSFPHNKYIAKLYFINLLIKHFNYI